MLTKYEHLTGKIYHHADANCYSLVRDYFKDNFSIDLRNYAIPSDWDSDQINLIEDIYQREGFEKVADWTLKDLRPGDVLCTAIHAANPNHLCIYVGDNLILHHPYGQLSRTDMLRDFWRMTTCYVVRHKDAPHIKPELNNITIQELIDARNSI